MNVSSVLAVVQLAVVLTAFGSAASAGPANGPCAEDMKKFCADVKPGDGAVAGCLKQHQSDLSAACKAHQEQIRTKADAFAAACGADLKTHCADVKPGRGVAMKCLHDKQNELSPDCEKMLEKRDAAMRKGHGPGPMTK